jgi:dGTPase
VSRDHVSRDLELNLSRVHADPLSAAALKIGGGREDVDGYNVAELLVDRQRVVHSAAFRRLQHKTQVFGANASDHFRSRLTHTMEVAHWAMLLARGLGCCVELAEVAALAHDLGHAPFGHAGERALNECLADHGGFEHNAYTLRVVEYLEHPYPDFRGLNLTRSVRECLAKHSTRYDKPGEHPLRDGTRPPVESEIVDLADRLAYGLHDLQDGLYAGLIEPPTLREISLWRECYAGVSTDYADWPGHLRPTIDAIQLRLAQAALRASSAVVPIGVETLNTGLSIDERVCLDAEHEALFDALEHFLLDTLYHHPEIQASDRCGRESITRLFDHYVSDPSTLPARFSRRVDEQGARRVAADYIAGMTDRFCLQQSAAL